MSTTPTEVLPGELRPAVGVVHQRLRVTVTAGCTDLSAQDASAIGYRTRRARVNLRVGVDDRLGNGEQCLGSAWLSKTWDAIMRETANNERTDRLEIHNSCVDERLADAHLCALVHLPTGRTCILPIAHPGSCQFTSPDQARRVAQRSSS